MTYLGQSKSYRWKVEWWLPGARGGGEGEQAAVV
jgi:hypothetical protein